MNKYVVEFLGTLFLMFVIFGAYVFSPTLAVLN